MGYATWAFQSLLASEQSKKHREEPSPNLEAGRQGACDSHITHKLEESLDTELTLDMNF